MNKQKQSQLLQVKELIKRFNIALREYNKKSTPQKNVYSNNRLVQKSYYQQAKQYQTQQRDLIKALKYYLLSIQVRQRKDSAIKDFASSLHQLGFTKQAVKFMDCCQKYYDGNLDKYLRLRDNLAIQFRPTGKHQCKYLLLEHFQYIYKDTNILYKDINILYKDINILYKDINILHDHEQMENINYIKDISNIDKANSMCSRKNIDNLNTSNINNINSNTNINRLGNVSSMNSIKIVQEQVKSNLFKNPKRIKSMRLLKGLNLLQTKSCQFQQAQYILFEFQSYSAAKKTLESFNTQEYFACNLYWVNSVNMQIVCAAIDGKTDFQQGFLIDQYKILKANLYNRDSIWTIYADLIYQSRNSNGFINLWATHALKWNLRVSLKEKRRENIFERSKITTKQVNSNYWESNKSSTTKSSTKDQSPKDEVLKYAKYAQKQMLNQIIQISQFTYW